MSPALAGRFFTTSATWKAPQKEIKVIKTETKEGKLYIFADDMYYIYKPKDIAKKSLELINESNKVAWLKITIQKLFVFLYTNNKLSERNQEKTPTYSERIKYLGISLNKKAKEQYTENCNINEIKWRRYKQMQKYSILKDWKINVV